MMRARLIALRERQSALAARAQGERERIEIYLGRADAALGWLDRGREMLGEAKRHPLLLAGVVLVLFALRPRRVLRLAASAWSAWQLVRRLQRWWAAQGPRALRGPVRAP